MKHYHLFILMLLLSTRVFSQVTGKYNYHGSHYLCSSSINLFLNGTYFIESGCEASSLFAIGTWKQRKDTISLHQLDSTFKIISKVVKSTSGTKTFAVKVYDECGNNVTGKYIVGQQLRNGNTYTMDLDSSKTFRYDVRKGEGNIVITSLERKFGAHTKIPIDTADTYEIHLNNLEGWTFPPNRSILSDFGNFELTIVKEGLRTAQPEPDDHGDFVKKVYRKELGIRN